MICPLTMPAFYRVSQKGRDCAVLIYRRISLRISDSYSIPFRGISPVLSYLPFFNQGEENNSFCILFDIKFYQ
jgi:hypothetical protein